MTRLKSFESREPDETAHIAEMTDILRRKMERDYEKGDTRRDAHPKTVALLKGSFQIRTESAQVAQSRHFLEA